MEKEELADIAFEHAMKNEKMNEMKEKDALLYVVLLIIYTEAFQDGYNEFHNLVVNSSGEIKEGGEQ